VSSLRGDLDPRRIPAHVAIVMDGNGRWAKERGLPRTKGHEQGEKALYDVVEGGLEIGLPYLTVYAFSTENWRRPPSEVRFLMGFNRTIIRRRRDELHERGVRIQFLGRRDRRLPRSVVAEMEAAERLTRGNDRMVLTIALNYGGRSEVVDAVRALLADHDAGRVKGGRITEQSIARRLYRPGVPDPDLVIRTSGEMRISNFLIWQAAYAELWFTPVFWPDFTREHLFEAIRDFQKRDRRFGGVGE
jgi:undecaprenyl diphosphate synthase